MPPSPPERLRPRIGVTLGDPSGIGPEIVLRVLGDAALTACVQPIIYGDAGVLRRVAQAARLAWPASVLALPVDSHAPWSADAPAILLDSADPTLQALRPGAVQVAAGVAAAEWIRAATRDALNGRLLAMTTAPVHKLALSLAGVPHPGHTEMLAELTGVADTVMMFMAPDLIVSLATIHMALEAVPRALTTQRLGRVIGLTAASLRRHFDREPRLGILGLNPHGGEGGRFGRTEIEVIAPAIQAARTQGMLAEGPLVPDIAFIPAHRRRFDAFVAMYHDQALIPFKMLAFDFGVNVTLGLPFIRTSVDHGTAFDIAWQGKASANSLRQAIRLAATLEPG